MATQTADIIIIGGGLLGTSAAYQLAKRKAGKIVLCEQNDIASQATSRAACLLTRARTKPGLMELVQETYDCIEEIQSELNESLDLQQVGSLTISASEASKKGLEDTLMAAQRFGIEAEIVGPKAVKEMLPWIDNTSVREAVWMPTDAFIDAALLCNGYAKAAKKRGVVVRTRTGVSAILHSNQRVTGVRLSNNDEIHAPVVIDAAGAWSNLLSFPLGIGLPHTPVRSHFWITEVNPALFPANQPFAVLPDARAFTRPDVGALIVGIREPECVSYDPKEMKTNIEHVDFTPDNGWSTLSQSASLFEAFFPQFRDLGIAHYMAGPSCYVPDANFIIGGVSSMEGFYTSSGCCGGGVAAGGGMGRLLSEIVTGEETFVNAAPFDPERFGAINPFNPAFQKSCADARSNKKGG